MAGRRQRATIDVLKTSHSELPGLAPVRGERDSGQNELPHATEGWWAPGLTAVAIAAGILGELFRGGPPAGTFWALAFVAALAAGVVAVVALYRGERSWLALHGSRDLARGRRVPDRGDRRRRLAAHSSGMSEASAIASAAGFAILSRFGRTIPAAIQASISVKSSSISTSDGTFFSTRPCA